jgi:Pyridoxamine 5'-phosphate oxidase
MKVHPEISDGIREFIEAQHMFFVATAPIALDGHVNLSPKGLEGSFLVLGPHRVAYLDYGGSGAETIAHLRENGRITLMFAAFDGPPNIVRLFGHGRAVFAGTAEFDELHVRFPVTHNRLRAIIDVEVERVQDSCGYAVPLMSFESHRDRLTANWAEKDPDVAEVYWAAKNPTSIDGLPAMPPATAAAKAAAGRR